jgi:hypothetical protein
MCLFLILVSTLPFEDPTVKIARVLGRLSVLAILLTCVAVPASAQAPNVSAMWKLDETTGATSIADSSGNGRNATHKVPGNTTGPGNFTPGQFGNAVDLAGNPGATRWVSSPNFGTSGPGPSQITGTSDVTISGWVRASGGGTIVTEVDNANLPGGHHDQWMAIDNAGNYYARVWNSAQLNVGNIGGFGDGEWHHVVLRYNDSTNTLDGFLDGVEAGADVALGGERGGTPNPHFHLGAADSTAIGAAGQVNAGYLNGALDDFTIYRDSLTNGEVGWLYEFGTEFGYDSGEVQQLFGLADTQSGSVTIDGTTWTGFAGPIPAGLTDGEVDFFANVGLDGGFIARVNGDLIASLAVPEPHAIACWAIIGLCIAGTAVARRRMHRA